MCRDDLISYYVNKLINLPFTLGVVLFGSYARGKETPLSDIDICVLDDTRFPIRERKKVFELQSLSHLGYNLRRHERIEVRIPDFGEEPIT
ncbi:MAG: nucleotidyltransferase domain-containing protein [Candidatus Hydrothermarchaeota archaeon]